METAFGVQIVIVIPEGTLKQPSRCIVFISKYKWKCPGNAIIAKHSLQGVPKEETSRNTRFHYIDQ